MFYSDLIDRIAPDDIILLLHDNGMVMWLLDEPYQLCMVDLFNCPLIPAAALSKVGRMAWYRLTGVFQCVSPEDHASGQWSSGLNNYSLQVTVPPIIGRSAGSLSRIGHGPDHHNIIAFVWKRVLTGTGRGIKAEQRPRGWYHTRPYRNRHGRTIYNYTQRSPLESEAVMV